MARLAIADPPYLGRANRWYGTGRGASGGRHVAWLRAFNEYQSSNGSLSETDLIVLDAIATHIEGQADA